MDNAVPSDDGRNPDRRISIVNDAITFVLDSRGCISSCSTRAKDLFEISPTPDEPLPLTELFEPVEQQQLASAVKSARNGRPGRFEYWHKLPGGVRCCIAWKISLDPESQSVVASGRNITRARTIDDPSADERGRYRAVFAQAMDAFLLLQAVYDRNESIADFIYLDLNEYAEKLLCSPRRSVIGRRLRETGPFSKSNELFEKYVHVVETGMTLEEELPLQSSDGMTRWIRHQAVAVPNGIALTARDITEEKKKERILQHEVDERQRAERELRSSQQALKILSGFLRNTIDSLPDPMVVKDSGHRWIAVNQAFCEFLGKRPGDLLGKTDYELFPEDLAASSWKKDAEVFKTANTLEYEEQITNAAGETRTVSTKKSVFRDFRGSQILVGISRDITAAKDVERQLVGARHTAEQATQAKTDFLAKMSHEIRTPLNGVIGMSTLLLDTSLDEKQRECAEVLKHSAEHLLDVVNDVLDLSKIEAGKLELDVEMFALRDSLSTLEAMHAPLCKRNGMSFSLNVSPEVPDFVQGDRRRLLQVLVNLLSNAIKFTESEGRISLSVDLFDRKSGRVELVFKVSDSGKGIPQDADLSIFEPFEQGSTSVNKSFGGSGLGLAICVELVELMGGRIWAERNRQDGTDFNVRLWLDCPGLNETASIAAENRQQLAANGTTPSETKPLRVLLVEDNRINQRVASRMLQKANHEVTLAANGKEAVDAFLTSEFDLVLMDIQMPVMDGYEATKELRAIEAKRGAYTPIIALTAHATQGDRERCLNAGMDDYLPKPITRSRLFARVHHWCSREQSNGELPSEPYSAEHLALD